jgi:hypothetical protein
MGTVVHTCHCKPHGRLSSIVVQGQPRQKNLGDPIPMEKSWAWWYIPIISVTVGNLEGPQSRPAVGKKRDPIQK